MGEAKWRTGTRSAKRGSVRHPFGFAKNETGAVLP